MFLSDGSYGVYVTPAESTEVQPGDKVDVVGFPTPGDYAITIQWAVVRRLSRGTAPAPRVVTAQMALSGDHDAALVRSEGRLLNRQRAASRYNLLMDSNETVFSAVLPSNQVNQTLERVADGSKIQLIGGGPVRESRNFRLPKDFQHLLRSAADIEVLGRPSWWTLRHALYVIGMNGAAIIGVLVWVAALRQRVRRQTLVIAKQLQRAATLKEAAEAAAGRGANSWPT